MRPTVSDVANRLARQTGASESTWEQDDSSRVIYELVFHDEIGFDWCKSQVKEVQNEMGEDLQMWKIRSSTGPMFAVSVKELEPRYDIDDAQSEFSDYE